MREKSIQPRKQRKWLFQAPLHKKRKWLAAHLAENLLLKYDRRSIPVVKGDTVKIMRGNFRGHEDKVSTVHVKKQSIEVEGVTLTKADGTKLAKPIHASNVLITKLNLTDKWRREKLERGLSETERKEIEKEAEAQIKEIEEQKKAEEAAAAKEAEEIATEEEAPPVEVPSEDKEEKEKQKTSKKQDKDTKPEKKATSKAKKAPPKKKSAGKKAGSKKSTKTSTTKKEAKK